MLDLGCGVGGQTLHLVELLPGATITAIDSHAASPRTWYLVGMGDANQPAHVQSVPDQEQRGVRSGAVRLLETAFLILVVWASFATGTLTAERALGARGGLALLAGALCAAVMWGVVVLMGQPVARALSTVLGRYEHVSVAVWLAGCIALATVLRLAWVLVLPPVQISDMRIYLELARSLAERGVFQYGTDRIYMPPGLPLVLAPGVKLFGAATFLPFALNLLLGAGTILITAALSRRLAGGRVLRLATLLLAVWPNLVFLSGLASKELLVQFLLTLAAWLYLEGAGKCGSPHAWSAALAGLVFGGAALTQPNTLVLLPAFAVFELIARTPVPRVFARLGLLAAGTAVVITPWTIRNYLLFQELVPVSANFGHSLFVGNHAGADGGFQPVRDAYTGMGELEYERMARQKAWHWIRANPRTFLVLVPRKQMLLLGDDADGAYHALKWAHGISDFRYVIAKGVSSAYWLGILTLIGISLRARRRRGQPDDARLALLMLFWFCLLALLSVTESGARHHIALCGFAALLASLGVSQDESSARGAGTVPGSRGLPAIEGDVRAARDRRAST